MVGDTQTPALASRAEHAGDHPVSCVYLHGEESFKDFFFFSLKKDRGTTIALSEIGIMEIEVINEI